MQKQANHSYWSKNNYFRAFDQAPAHKSTLKESVKGLCTNIWYKMGGESILTAKSVSSCHCLSILGRNYNTLQEAQNQFQKLFWFTYRKQISSSSHIRGDLGWGCLIRVGQMFMANALKRYFENNGIEVDEASLITAFLDDQGSQQKYSFQKIIAKGSQKFNVKAGQWVNISQIGFILMGLQNKEPMKGSQDLSFLYFNQSLFFLDEIYNKINLMPCTCKNKKINCRICHGSVDYRKSKEHFLEKNRNVWEDQFQELKLQESFVDVFEDFQEDEESPTRNQSQLSDCLTQQKKPESVEGLSNGQGKKNGETEEVNYIFDLLILVSTRISHKDIDSESYRALLQLLNLPTSMGILGGVPGKGLYFVGCQNENLIYLDPHLVQNPVNRANLSKQLKSFHCEHFRTISRSKLDSSVGFAFYLRNLNDLKELVNTIDELKRQNSDSVPISYMWDNEFRDSADISMSYEADIEECSPEFSFIA